MSRKTSKILFLSLLILQIAHILTIEIKITSPIPPSNNRISDFLKEPIVFSMSCWSYLEWSMIASLAEAQFIIRYCRAVISVAPSEATI